MFSRVVFLMNGPHSCFILNMNLIVENNEFLLDASDEEKGCNHLLSKTYCTAELQI